MFCHRILLRHLLKLKARGINAGSKHDFEDMCDAISATGLEFNDIVDKTWKFEEVEEAVQHLWEGRQVGKYVVQIQ